MGHKLGTQKDMDTLVYVYRESFSLTHIAIQSVLVYVRKSYLIEESVVELTFLQHLVCLIPRSLVLS